MTLADDLETLRLSRELATDLVVRAGAGTGKTHTLVEVYVALVAGETALGRRVPPARILALTFSEKAAAELRERVRARLEEYARVNRPPLSAADWREAALAIGGSPIATFHSFAAGLLRRHAGEVGIDPGFVLLDEDEATALRRAETEAVVLRALEAGAPREVRELVRDLGFGGGDGAAKGLVDYLVEVAARLEEEGRAPASLAAAADTRAEARVRFDQARCEVRAAMAALAEALEPGGRKTSPRIVELGARLAACREAVERALEGMRLEGVDEGCDGGDGDSGSSDGLDTSRGRVGGPSAGVGAGRQSAGMGGPGAGVGGPSAGVGAGRQSAGMGGPGAGVGGPGAGVGGPSAGVGGPSAGVGGPSAGARDPIAHPALRELLACTTGPLGTEARNAASRRLRDATAALREAWATARAARWAAAFAALADEAERAYRAAKAARGALDFGDLVTRARALLESDAAARAETQGRFDAILVDEFQDTNELQEGLVRQVQGEGARRLVVGDAKQSIYEFRGADVAVFGRVAKEVSAAGGRILSLRTSRRGRRPLVELINRLFARAMTGGEHPFEIAFDPEFDALEAVRDGEEPCVELLDDEAEARAIALDVRARVEAGEARWRDVAILLRRFTHLDRYLSEFRRAKIPYYVVNGRGFYEAQEIRDLSHALTLLEDPDDALALLGVLRSPLVGLSDAAIATLAQAAGTDEAGRPRRLSLRPMLRADFVPPAALAPDEAERLRAFLALYRRLGRHADRLGPADVLRLLVEETDLAAVLATTHHGEQRVANLERLLDVAAEHQASRGGSLLEFARRLRVEAQRERSLASPAQILGEWEDVVRVMTIHQSKGLEFPIVYVPECGALEREPNGAVVYDRAVGIGFRVRGADGDRVPSAQARRAQEIRRARARAESLRLFYVAATRARDRLVLSGRAVSGGESWRKQVDRWREEDGEARRLLQVRTVAPCREGGDGTRLETRAAESDEARPRVAERPPEIPPLDGLPAPDLEDRAWAQRTLAAPSTGAATIVATVSELFDVAECPQRSRWTRSLGLDEDVARGRGAGARRILGGEVGEDGDEGASAGLDAREKGTLAHRLLERIDLRAWAWQRLGALDELLEKEGWAPGRLPAEVAEVREAVARLLEGPLGRLLAARTPDEIYRELPFAFVPRGPAELGDGPPGVSPEPRLLVKGQIDLLVLEPGRATIIDYKLSRAADAPDYRFQLAAYAAAVRAAFRPERLRAGLAFLRDRDPGPHFFDLTEPELDATEARLVALARSVQVLPI